VSDSDGSSKKIKVVDRRRFTEDGDPREPAAVDAAPDAVPDAGRAGAEAAAPRPPATPHPGDSGQAAAPQVDADLTESSAAISRDFIELVAMLAQQAEMILVGTDQMPAQPDHAKRLIDYLGALEAKTKGNLSADEQRLLSNVVFELRTMFVQATR
jgi:hypothetical protein